MVREFRMTIYLGGYEMKELMLDIRFDVNILPKKSWELLGRPKIV